jgi:aminoglycoside 2''-phosphotransferase
VQYRIRDSLQPIIGDPMANHLDSLRERVQALMPDLVIEQFKVNQEGLVNDVVIVNGSLVFRFAKTASAAAILETELRILDLVRPQLGLDVPTPIYRSSDTIVYPFLTGKPLLRAMLQEIDAETQKRLANQLGKFLFGLHTTDLSKIDWTVPSTLAPVTRDKWLDLRQRVEQKIYPLLLKHQIQWAENLFDSVLNQPESFVYKNALIHGDLAPYHIFYDEQKLQITGVIDFGVAGLGDPALDIGSLITCYGESFVAQMQDAYPGLEIYLPRARFYAQSIELQWVLLGLETGENFWFTAHLGGARDVRA